MTLYHEATEEALENILTDGLKCTSRGEKGDDSDIIATDRYLDERCPANLRARGLSRDNNIYAFAGTNDTLIDITNGATLALRDYPLEDSRLLRLAADEATCYVSDLDRYDAIRTAIANRETATLATLADHYWSSIIPLRDFTIGDVSRPEVMITTDIPPTKLTLI